MHIQELQNKIVRIDDYQATFLILEVEGNLLRFNLVDKREFYLKKDTAGNFNYFKEHPLLVDHNENVVTTYINSKVPHIESFFQDIKSAIEKKSLGWRNWTNYLGENFTPETFHKNLQTGMGKLLEAPFSITQEIVNVCNRHKVMTQTFGDALKLNSYKLITIEGSYVVAKEFKFST